MTSYAVLLEDDYHHDLVLAGPDDAERKRTRPASKLMEGRPETCAAGYGCRLRAFTVNGVARIRRGASNA